MYMVSWSSKNGGSDKLSVDQKISHASKMQYIGAMQKCHERASWEIVDTVFSLNPGKRDELVQEDQKHPVTMVDFADIPDAVSDTHLLRLIAAMLDKTYYEEKKSNQERTNTFLLRDSGDEVVVSPELLRIMERKLKNAIDELLKVKVLRPSHIQDLKKYFTKDVQDNIVFKDQNSLLYFLRKTTIKWSEILPDYSKTKNILIICSLLKQILRHHDFKGQKKNIHQVRELLEKFVRGDLLSMLDWEAKSSDIEPIKDISHSDYFNDKVFIFRRDLLEKYNIHYYKDIHVKIAYRAKQDESIEDKLMIEPTAKTASMLHDLWWLKYVVLGESQKEERIILLYFMFLMYAEREQKYNPRINAISPSNDDNTWFLPWGKYANKMPIIEQFLNEMTVKDTYDDNTPLLKDKWIMPLSQDSVVWKWNLDYALLEKLNIVDARFIHLLEKALDKKHIDHMKKIEQQARTIDDVKKQVFIEKVFNSEDGWDPLVWRWMIKKNTDILRKVKKIESWNGLDSSTSQSIVNTNRQSKKYEFWMNSVNEIYMHPADKPEEKYLLSTYNKYFERFKTTWEEHIYLIGQKNKNSDHKWARQDGKTASNVRVGYKEHEKVPVETQVLWENEINNLPMIDDHIIFNPAKKLLVHGRNNSGILSLNDIYNIVDRNVIAILEKYPQNYCENGKTYQQLSELIVADDTLLPKWWTLREKIAYNFIHNRGLKSVWYIYFTKYYYNLKHHGLTPAE